jgi:LuxR family transcriptional regulator, quorum-sensing system regulator BjaR1
MIRVEDLIDRVEACQTIEELKETLQFIAEQFGFSAFNFFDNGRAHQEVPFFMGTLRQDFIEGYVEQDLLRVDPCVSIARRSNTAFTWKDVEVPQYRGARKSGAQRTMEFAEDHGYQEGFIVPFHFADRLGRPNSCLVVFFWSSTRQKFQFLVSRRRYDIHLIMIYWAQRAVDIVGEKFRDGARFSNGNGYYRYSELLTDRERDVLAWAARGKTRQDTATILKLSEDTVKTHLTSCLQKLEANNKTQAVAKAIALRLIDL